MFRDSDYEIPQEEAVCQWRWSGTKLKKLSHISQEPTVFGFTPQRRVCVWKMKAEATREKRQLPPVADPEMMPTASCGQD